MTQSILVSGRTADVLRGNAPKHEVVALLEDEARLRLVCQAGGVSLLEGPARRRAFFRWRRYHQLQRKLE